MTSLNGLKAFLKKYDDVVQSRQENNDICASEFQVIKFQSAEDKKDVFALEGARDVNKKKNRYKDILPYDHSRVVLQKDQFVDGSDYINANHVEDMSGKRSYIAAQGPMPHTVDDFWKLIWQFKVEVVIMGCKEVELGRNRCHRYWAEAGEELWFDDIKVSLVVTTQYAHNMVLRKLKAEKNGVIHMLSQLHYQDWPDHGAPETSETILQLMKVFREKQPFDDPPILIHCSAGCGRTGAIIAIDCGRKLINAHANDIDVLTIVSRLRKHRPALVQSKDQYEFIYQVFCEMVQREISLCEGQYDRDYMNINALPIKKDTRIPSVPLPQPVPQPRENISRLNALLPIDVKRQIVLPQEHAVNTDGSGIRRTRSAYMKKSTNVPNVFVPSPAVFKAGPPEVPMKENKFKLSEGPVLPPKSPTLEKSPTLPPKSPGLLQRSPRNVQPLPDRNCNSSSEQIQRRPQLHKKTSIDSFFGDINKSEYDYINLEHLSTPQEDFIPAAIPVGYSQYPMATKMTHSTTSHPKVPARPSSGAVKGINTPNIMPAAMHIGHTSNQSQEPFVTTNQISVQSQANKTSLPIRDDYAVVDKSKKTNRSGDDKPKHTTKELPKEAVLYDYISSDTNAHPHVSATNRNEQGAVAEPRRSTAPPVILPYTVTDVGFGYKRNPEGAQGPVNTRDGVSSKSVMNKEKQPTFATQKEAPALPVRRGVSFPPSEQTNLAVDGMYSEISHQPEITHHQFEKLTQQITESSQQSPPTAGKKWFNAKVKNLAKRTSNPCINVSPLFTEAITMKQPFYDINDKFGYPHRLHVKPTGPRPPPSSWKIPTL